MDARDRILFVYGTLLSGERSHERLGTATKLGEARTEPIFHLVDLGPYPALVIDGTTAVSGEIYRVEARLLRELDVFEQVPILFERVQIPLDGGSLADAYVMDVEKTRGKRRIAHGDWSKRMSVSTPSHDGPFARRARGAPRR
ncbi:MAG: gamma-glutamylcyclotransferase family protein [Polyangiaceae bacterium]